MGSTSTARRLLVALVVVLAAAVAPVAHGGAFTDSAVACSDRDVARPFLRWLDPLQYTLVPNGGFEQGATGWTLAGGARVVSGNEPYYVRSTSDRFSLSLPAGSSATSRPVCVELLDSVARFVVKGPLLRSLKVEVLYEDRYGKVQAVSLLPTAGLGSWQPSLPHLLLANVNLANVFCPDGESTAVALRFRPIGLSSWRIDDVYVDPFLHR
jgi:hypothetical protein